MILKERILIKPFRHQIPKECLVHLRLRNAFRGGAVAHLQLQEPCLEADLVPLSGRRRRSCCPPYRFGRWSIGQAVAR